MDHNIIIGEILTLTFLLSDGNYSTSSYISKVQELGENNEFFISPPFTDFNEKYNGKSIRVYISRKDSAYYANAEIVKFFDSEVLPLVKVRLVEKFKRTQRREFYRLKINLEIVIDGCRNCKTLDISGNGTAFVSNTPFHEQQNIKGSIILDDDSVEFSGIVIRCEKDSEIDAYIVCVHFAKIDLSTQDKIVKFICQKQRTQIRRARFN